MTGQSGVTSVIQRMAPVTYYPLYDRTPGLSLIDDLMSASNGTQGGGVTSARLRNLRAAQFRTASSQWVNSDAAINIGGANCSIVCMIRPTAFAAGSPFINNVWGADDGLAHTHCFRLVSGAVQYLTENTTPTSYTVTGPTLTVNRNYLLGGTFDGTTARLYVQGLQYNTTGVAGSVSANVRLGIGSRSGSYSRGFDGIISHCAGWSRTLGADEMRSIFLAVRREMNAAPQPAFN